MRSSSVPAMMADEDDVEVEDDEDTKEWSSISLLLPRGSNEEERDVEEDDARAFSRCSLKKTLRSRNAPPSQASPPANELTFRPCAALFNLSCAPDDASDVDDETRSILKQKCTRYHLLLLFSGWC